MREHVALLTRAAFALMGAGGALGVYGGYQAIHNAHARTGWIWLAAGFVLLFLSQVRAVQTAIGQRDAALLSAGQSVTGVAFGEGAGSGGSSISISEIQTMVGAGFRPERPTRRRRWPRRLSAEQREDLGERLQTCSSKALSFLNRPEPGYGFHGSEEERRAADEARDAHRAETKRVFSGEYVAQMRDLLNEAAEAGYSLPENVEQFRVGSMHMLFEADLAQAVGIVGRRVLRGSKRLV